MKFLSAAFALSLLIGSRATAAEKLNVVFILADDLGWADLGCYGSKYHQTPNLDRFAKQSARFTHAYAAPVCSPTRAALMTGKHPARIGITDWLPGNPDRPENKLLHPKLPNELSAKEKTLAAKLKAAGYVTGHIGKWHLGGEGAGPLQRGFDVNIGGDHTGTALNYFAPFKDKNGRFMPGLEQAPEGEYLTDRLTAEAEKFIDANRDKPFFLYLPHYTVHMPMKAKLEIVAKYKQGPLGSQGNPVYAAMIESLDDSVGRILKKLDDLGLAGKTLVIFNSDNGGLSYLANGNPPPTVNSPLRDGKGCLYEGGIRVPLIVRWPGVTKAGTTIAEPVCAIDYLPTILEACGIKDDEARDGMSIVPLLKGESIKREALYWHYPHYHNGQPGAAIRAGKWKLIEFYDPKRIELYDLTTDQGEIRNVSATQPQVVKELSEKLAAWRKDVGAKMMTPNPNYKPNPQGARGEVVLSARRAEVHGSMLHFESLPNKNTLGYWTRADDWASWDFTIDKAGSFTVEILYGCGKKQGGSEIEVAVEKQAFKFTVADTGGYQSFQSTAVGTLKLEAGQHTLTLKPQSKAGLAVMDVRSITLKPSKE